jgi:glycosyltransferase involved in cell wall biosynthesis
MKRPLSVPGPIRKALTYNGRNRAAAIIWINHTYLPRKFRDPVVSVVIPARNESELIVRTILSLCLSNTALDFEIIVVDNNSTDDTEKVIRSMGLRYMHESVIGITATRNAGLGAARGNYILSADADTVYPPDWIDCMVKPMIDSRGVAATYGPYAFLPDLKHGRLGYMTYEHGADFSKWLVRRLGEEATCVYGFNFGFRREQAMAVDWFNHPRDASEDGWLALKLRDKGFGNIVRIRDRKAMVWTSARKIAGEGGLWRTFWKRAGQTLRGDYW